MNQSFENSLVAADLGVQYDIAAKTILSYKSVLSRILALTVKEFSSLPPEDIEELIEDSVHTGSVPLEAGMTNKKGEKIAGLNTFDAAINEGIVTYDILFYVRTGDGLSKFIINIEAQRQRPRQYNILNRSLFYACRLVSSQKGREFVGENYDDLESVYTIWICMNTAECGYNHIHLVNDFPEGEYEWKGKLNLINAVILGVPNKLPDKEDKKHELHRFLTTIFSSALKNDEKMIILREEYKMTDTHGLLKEADKMCNLSQGIREEGIAEGRAEGIVVGRAEMHRDDALRLYKEKAMDSATIADILNEREEQVKAWIALRES